MHKVSVSVSSRTYDAEIVNSNVPVVVDFWAPWCGPCKVIGPVLEELGEEYLGKVKVAKVNVDEEQALANQFGVRGIPTLVVMFKGEYLGQMVGFGGKQSLIELFAELAKLAGDAIDSRVAVA